MDAGRHTVVALLRPDVERRFAVVAAGDGGTLVAARAHGGARSHVVVAPVLPGG